MRVGVLDIGSNSVLLLIGERTPSGWRVLTDQTRITRLGEGFGVAKRLQLEAVQRTLRAIDEYLAECRAWQAERIVAAATAVVREASNANAILQPLRERLPPHAEIRVLSEQEEATLSYLSVALDDTLGIGAERPGGDRHRRWERGSRGGAGRAAGGVAQLPRRGGACARAVHAQRPAPSARGAGGDARVR
jgi:hypothetical protein